MELSDASMRPYPIKSKQVYQTLNLTNPHLHIFCVRDIPTPRNVRGRAGRQAGYGGNDVTCNKLLHSGQPSQLQGTVTAGHCGGRSGWLQWRILTVTENRYRWSLWR